MLMRLNEVDFQECKLSIIGIDDRVTAITHTADKSTWKLPGYKFKFFLQ